MLVHQRVSCPILGAKFLPSLFALDQQWAQFKAGLMEGAPRANHHFNAGQKQFVTEAPTEQRGMKSSHI